MKKLTTLSLSLSAFAAAAIIAAAVTVTPVDAQAGFFTSQPVNVANTSCSSGEAKMEFAAEAKRATNTISRLPDGTLLSKGEIFGLNGTSTKKTKGKTAGKAPNKKLWGTIYFNPGVSDVVIVQFWREKDVLAYSHLYILDSASSATTVAKFNAAWTSICTDKAENLDIEKGGWLKGGFKKELLTRKYEVKGATAYMLLPEFGQALQDALPGVTISKLGRYSISDAPAVLHSLLDTTAKTAFDNKIKAFFESDAVIGKYDASKEEIPNTKGAEEEEENILQ